MYNMLRVVLVTTVNLFLGIQYCGAEEKINSPYNTVYDKYYEIFNCKHL